MSVKPSRKILLQATLAVFMSLLVGGLLIWQDQRYRLVGECHASGGQWDGPSGRCRPVPRIFIERGLKRT